VSVRWAPAKPVRTRRSGAAESAESTGQTVDPNYADYVGDEYGETA
jgi:hypothetical protein